MITKNSHRLYSTLAVLTMLCTALFVSGCVAEIQTSMDSEQPILSQLDNAEQYYHMHPSLEKAFAFLKRKDLADLPLEKHEIDGDRLFCTLSKNKARKQEDAKLESHRKYIDIHYIIDGQEKAGWKPTSDCKVIYKEYDQAKDIMFFKDAPDKWIQIPAGSFAIYSTQDAHAPFVGDSVIHKAVVKIAVE